jgi:chitin synthase
MVLQNSIFRNLVVSLCSTYVIYLLSSLLFMEPWHMVTSFVQYLLLSPSFVNILNVYAFCNTHDVSWGTKGDDKMSTDLGVAKTKDDGTLEVEIPTEARDLDAAYETALQILATKPPPQKRKRGAMEKQEDYYKGFRSSVVLIWMFSNAALCAIVLNVGGISRIAPNNEDQKTSIYLTVVLWSVAVLSAIRFVGSILFLLKRLFRGG